MKLKYSFLVLIPLFFIWSCAGTKPNSESIQTANDTTFIKLVEKIPALKLPYSINCDFCCETAQLENAQEFAKYIPPKYEIIGLLNRMDSSTLILTSYKEYEADISKPSVLMYGNDGNLIAVTTFLNSWCGENLGSFGDLNLRINSDLTIIEEENNYTFTLDSITGNIIDTTAVEEVVRQFKIDNKGALIPLK